MYIDVFNGDADGICALHQLRLAKPVDGLLVTGIKRDIGLLSRVSAGDGDCVTVLDISLDKNREALISLLDLGAKVTYFDHHFAGDIPLHPQLLANIDTQPDTCTSLLVNKTLQGKYRAWAVTAAFGDNLFESARQAATSLNLSADDLELLKKLGTCINYNGYGASLDDLYFHPAELYKKIKPYENPFDFIKADDAFNVLLNGYEGDMSKAASVTCESDDAGSTVYILPNDKWARRVSGIYGNDLAQQHPDKAHAILTLKGEGVYQVSVRAPLKTKTGADTLCRQFATGGGRQAAAGINELPESELEHFVRVFKQHFGG
ncbi:hypothetical protein MNBD_GAMMA23-2560 [hydrothermal vent metagenome]|uniref:Uncharacterized protein n=1 Tax=hydrothermal vent metagenome TaxID=652676 RepID=A0A3B1AVE2_9ZZZZ